MIRNEKPPDYNVLSQLDFRCETLCKKVIWLFCFIIFSDFGALGLLLIHINESVSETTVFSWILASHFCVLALLCGYGIFAAKKQSWKNFKIILCFTLYLALIEPFHRCFQLFDCEMDTDAIFAKHLTDNLSLIFTLLSWFTFIAIYTLHFAFKQAEYFGKTGVLIFPEGCYAQGKV